jgi:hypothetical protein
MICYVKNEEEMAKNETRRSLHLKTRIFQIIKLFGAAYDLPKEDGDPEIAPYRK